MFFVIIDFEIVLRNFLGLTDLLKAQTLDMNKFLDVIMVSKNEDHIFATFYMVIPSLKSFNNC